MLLRSEIVVQVKYLLQAFARSGFSRQYLIGLFLEIFTWVIERSQNEAANCGDIIEVRQVWV